MIPKLTNRNWICLAALLGLSTAPAWAGTACAEEYHVAETGVDGNPGTEAHPFRTISAAAQIAHPGDVVTVHAGTYRERVNPPRGGTSHDRRIVYRSAPGQQVVITGAEIVKQWQRVRDDVWKVVLPNRFFGDFNPYRDVIGGEWYRTPRDGFDRHTGAVYLNGNWLDEAPSLADVLPPAAGEAQSPDTVLGGKTARYPGQAIAGTEEDPLYQTCRYDLLGYRLAVPDGTYRVTLKFCEPHFDAQGERIFDVALQGRTVLTAFDIFARVGKFAAHDEVFDGVEVTGGLLKIDLVNRVSLACISGIVLERGNDRRKINCGGPAWADYQDDPPPSTTAGHGRPLWYAEVNNDTTTIWAQFADADPNHELVEINVRQSVFYPDQPGRNYITVRGFTMRQAATPWSGAMSEQIGLLGTHWSKGWIIENNTISHSVNTGITLGRYDLGRFGGSVPEASAPGFVRSCELALEHGWSKANIGSHVVRNNHISHCEKNGIHGSLGGIFSTIQGNVIHDIAVRGWLAGADMAGLKLLGSVDVLIRDNHIYRCGATGGLWLDWMAQGTRVTGNLLHDNSCDLFMEVNHGPFLIDHNLLLSRSRSLREWSQGGAYAHNLFAGAIEFRTETRQTPFFKPHSVEGMQISAIQHKDLRFYNNLFAGIEHSTSLAVSGNVQQAGNLFLEHASCTLREEEGQFLLTLPESAEEASSGKRVLVTSDLLGQAAIPAARFEQPDGSPYRLDTDYFGRQRNPEHPIPGPFACSHAEEGGQREVWPK
jgi:hypothetical protein